MSLKNAIKEILYRLVRFLPANGAVILMYHSVGDNNNLFTVKPGDFEKQMAYLSENKFNIISLSSLLDILAGKKTILPKTVVITFDDGYEDNYLVALPVLKKYNLHASVFVITGMIGGERAPRGGTNIKMLSLERMKQMRDSGLIDFYPHTDSHPKLTDLSHEMVKNEIASSRVMLEKEFGGQANMFAYPYGKYNEAVIKVLKDQNFRGAVTVNVGRIKNTDDPFLLKRNSVDSKITWSMFKGIVHHGRL